MVAGLLCRPLITPGRYKYDTLAWHFRKAVVHFPITRLPNTIRQDSRFSAQLVGELAAFELRRILSAELIDAQHTTSMTINLRHNLLRTHGR